MFFIKAEARGIRNPGPIVSKLARLTYLVNGYVGRQFWAVMSNKKQEVM